MAGYQTGDAHNFVGFLDVYDGPTRARYNLIVNVRDETMPLADVRILGLDVQRSRYVLNLRDDTLYHVLGVGVGVPAALGRRIYQYLSDDFDFIGVVGQVVAFQNRFYVNVRNNTRAGVEGVGRDLGQAELERGRIWHRFQELFTRYLRTIPVSALGTRNRVTPSVFYYHGPIGAFAEFVRSTQGVTHAAGAPEQVVRRDRGRNERHDRDLVAGRLQSRSAPAVDDGLREAAAHLRLARDAEAIGGGFDLGRGVEIAAGHHQDEAGARFHGRVDDLIGGGSAGVQRRHQVRLRRPNQTIV
jgi:hypothetical protein